MKQMTYQENWPDINTGLYNRSVKLFSAVKHILSVKLELYADTQVLQGDSAVSNIRENRRLQLRDRLGRIL